MVKLNTDIDELFRYSEELVLAVEPGKNIVYLNEKAVSYFGKASSVTEIEHLFSFDVCILDNENIHTYTPLSEALLPFPVFRSEVFLQTGEDKYKKFSLRSLKNSDNTLIILSGPSAEDNEKIIAELERENKDFLEVKERASSLAIRTGLINRISNSIRDSLKIEEIINIITGEVTATLGLDRGYFTYINEIKETEDSGIKQAIEGQKPVVSNVMTDKTIGTIQARLTTPVTYRSQILGVLVFFHRKDKKIWNEEEIALIEGIASQLASAINQSKAQTQLVQSEKMASLGQLMAGVAHEVNTPLGAINSNNSIFSKCISKISGPDSVIEIFQEAIKTNSEAVRRINDLVKSLKNFARLDEAEYKEADLHEGIKNTLMLINHEIKDRIEVVMDFGEVPPINCYPNQLNQVFMNILVNAYQSIEDKGKITIKTEKNDTGIVVSISDTGCGIPKDRLPMIFDPGFTTKSVGVGTGLGLSICYQIIQKHNGKIIVESKEGKGTTFYIELPV